VKVKAIRMGYMGRRYRVGEVFDFDQRGGKLPSWVEKVVEKKAAKPKTFTTPSSSDG
jgi:hypothetical protein